MGGEGGVGGEGELADEGEGGFDILFFWFPGGRN